MEKRKAGKRKWDEELREVLERVVLVAKWCFDCCPRVPSFTTVMSDYTNTTNQPKKDPTTARDHVLEAVKQNGYALKHAAPKYKTECENVIEAL